MGAFSTLRFLINSFFISEAGQCIKTKTNKLFTIYTRYKEKGEKVTNQEDIHDYY
jgi:hypothetical protein